MWLLCLVARLFQDGKHRGADGRLGVLDYFSFSIKIGDSPHDILHILLCYATPFAATRVWKDKFYDDLQYVLSEIPSREMCVVMGCSGWLKDWNG